MILCVLEKFCKFKIDTVGNISNVKIYKGYSSKVDTEITRVIRLMPNWNPYKVLHGKLKTGKWLKILVHILFQLKYHININAPNEPSAEQCGQFPEAGIHRTYQQPW